MTTPLLPDTEMFVAAKRRVVRQSCHIKLITSSSQILNQKYSPLTHNLCKLNNYHSIA